MYALVSAGYSAFVCDPVLDLTICLSPDRACQCGGHRQIFIIPLPVRCLFATFEAVSVDRKAVIDLPPPAPLFASFSLSKLHLSTSICRCASQVNSCLSPEVVQSAFVSINHANCEELFRIPPKPTADASRH